MAELSTYHFQKPLCPTCYGFNKYEVYGINVKRHLIALVCTKCGTAHFLEADYQYKVIPRESSVLSQQVRTEGP